MTTVTEQTVVSERAVPVSISWKAIFAGLVTVVSILWAMSMLGAAIGLSVADATDAEAITQGFGIAATIWMLLTGIAAFFIGGLVTMRASGIADSGAGMLHGFVLWGSTLVAAMILTYWGIAGLINTGSQITTSVAHLATAGVAAAANADANTDGRNVTASSSPTMNRIANRISARVKRAAAQAIAADEDSNISQEEARRVIEQLDARTLEDVAFRLIDGDTEVAKDILAARTDLSERQIEQVVSGVEKETRQAIDQAKKELAEFAEAASTYAQGVMWTQVIAALVALLASIGGGMYGATCVDRLMTVAVTRRATTA